MISQNRETIFIVDAHGFLYRNYYALPKLSTGAGLEVGAMYGFMKWLAKLISERKPKYIAVCFDSPGGSAKRKEMFAQYKANRKAPDEALVTQLNLAREMVAGIGLHPFALKGYEADDIIGCIALEAVKQNADAVLVSSDKDICQILGPHVKIWPSGAGGADFKGPEYVQEKFGIDQQYLTDYLAIVGDSSDNIPGIKGVGEKTAVSLINQYGHLENIIEAAKKGDAGIKPAAAKKIVEGERDALLSKELVKTDCPAGFSFNLKEAEVKQKSTAELAALFAKYEFKNMLKFFKEEDTPGELFAEEIKGSSWAEVTAKIKEEVLLQAEDEYICLAADKDVYCIKRADELREEETAFLKNLVLDNKILKTGHDLKFTLRLLGIRPETVINIFDIKLAAYVLNPSEDLSFGALSAYFLSAAVPQDDEKALLAYQAAHAGALKEALVKEMKAKDIFEIYEKMELPLASVLLEMEALGFKVDKAWLQTFGATLQREIDRKQSEINTLAGYEVNINSPKQLGALLFENLKLPTVKKTKTGYSTDEEVLQKLAKLHPVAEKILEYRADSKLQSTYVQNLILLADRNSRVHTYLDQTGTVTGRLSSSTPNLQNIPIRTEKGRMLRHAFCAEEGNTLVSADYSQIDLRMLAHLSGDPALVSAFKEGGDIHAKTAAEVFGVMREMVSGEMRNSAKAINFGIVYGQGPVGLAQQLGITTAEAKEYIDGYFGTYKEVKKWIDQNIELARKHGYVKTILGHVRYLPEFNMGSPQMESFARRAAVNTIVQGSSADVIKKAMLDIFDHYHGSEIKMIMQVHDELIFEVPAAAAEMCARVVKEKMENTMQLDVPLLAEVKAGKNWYDMEKVKI